MFLNIQKIDNLGMQDNRINKNTITRIVQWSKSHILVSPLPRPAGKPTGFY